MEQLNTSTSFLRFLQTSESRIAKFLERAMYYERHYQDRKRKWATLMIKTDEVNYLTLRDDGTISYLPHGKEHLTNDDGSWSRQNRQNASAAKVIRKVLTKNAVKLFSDKEYEAFVNSYKVACIEDTKTFQVWDRYKIKEAYCMDREGCGGTLGDSCMNGDSEYLDLYEYCENLEIVVMLNGKGELSGRALLWSVGGNKYMDRIYAAQDCYYEMFLNHARSMGWHRKVEYKSYRDKESWVSPSGEVFNRTLRVNTPTEFDYYPYIDTFTYGGDGWISNNSNDSIYEYTCTGGGREEQDAYICEMTGNRIHEDDARYIENGRYGGGHLHCDDTVYCQTDHNYYYDGEVGDTLCEINDRYYRCDDDEVCEIDGDWYLTEDDDVTYSDYHNEYLLVDDCVYSEYHETYIKADEAVRVNGDVFHESMVERCA
jgi:hypothetical protein